MLLAYISYHMNKIKFNTHFLLIRRNLKNNLVYNIIYRTQNLFLNRKDLIKMRVKVNTTKKKKVEEKNTPKKTFK